MRHVQVSDEAGGDSTTSSGDDALAPAAAAAADPELGVPPVNGVHHGAQNSAHNSVLNGLQNGGGAIDGGKGPAIEGIELDEESEGQKGMVLPFSPMTVTFRDVHYYVPTEVSTAVQTKIL